MAGNLTRLSLESSEIIRKNGRGIVHLGIGAFHRAHQAWYTHKAMAEYGGDWCITGVSLRSATMADQLNPQNGLYTLIEQDSQGYKPTIISAVENVVVSREDPKSVLEVLTHSSTKIVSLTITEKGYCHDPSTGKLNLDHPDIQHDLAQPQSPKTAIGYLVCAMQQRLENGTSPFSVLSCDNLPANGQLLAGLVLDFAKQIDMSLANKIEQFYSFPSSMVDRIVPAVTADVRAYFCQRLGYDDQALVATEQFSQWVIEDNFVAGRPDWDKVGALMVKDVHAFETMKLRLLNGSHSAIAYIGYLSQLETVSDAISVSSLRKFIFELMQNELRPSVSVPDNINLDEYCEKLLQRFENPNLNHQTYQIAMDGSQKLPQRLLKPLLYQIQTGGDIQRICFVIAAWIQYVSGRNLSGQVIQVEDPMRAELAKIYSTHHHDEKQWVEQVFSINSIFDKSLASNTEVKNAVTNWLKQIRQQEDAISLLTNVMAASI